MTLDRSEPIKPRSRSQAPRSFWLALLASRNRDLYEKWESEPSVSHSGYSLCTCSETVIELGRIRTINPEPRFSGLVFFLIA